MASTTSAAASTLLSGSSTSGTVPSSLVGTTTSSGELRGMNFYLSDNSNPNLYYLPNSSISSSPSYPTITLDLTSTSSSSYLNNISSNSLSIPRYSTTNPNFSNGVLNYGTQVPYDKHQVGNSLHDFGPGQNPENFNHSFIHKGLTSNLSSSHQTLPTDAIAAATKSITSDPSFQSALATALNSIIGTSGGGGGGNGEF
ncbi:hypothetical protein Vadar_008472 [Vaccinium darrowii]|uniref:Uncharacterized protein n=1 Tax=Vaccinium darrowii TaxID=229202 RepID=A0ACB7YCD6_9ERIC|nr:hypothetical protein Vadar_008472 [Vaccinium darrowii]